MIGKQEYEIFMERVVKRLDDFISNDSFFIYSNNDSESRFASLCYMNLFLGKENAYMKTHGKNEKVNMGYDEFSFDEDNNKVRGMLLQKMDDRKVIIVDSPGPNPRRIDALMGLLDQPDLNDNFRYIGGIKRPYRREDPVYFTDLSGLKKLRDTYSEVEI